MPPRFITAKLVDEDIPARLLKTIHGHLQVGKLSSLRCRVWSLSRSQASCSFCSPILANTCLLFLFLSLGRILSAVLQPGDQGWFDGALNGSKLGAFIGTCTDLSLKEVLRRLKIAVDLTADDQKEVGSCLVFVGPVGDHRLRYTLGAALQNCSICKPSLFHSDHTRRALPLPHGLSSPNDGRP